MHFEFPRLLTPVGFEHTSLTAGHADGHAREKAKA